MLSKYVHLELQLYQVLSTLCTDDKKNVEITIEKHSRLLFLDYQIHFVKDQWIQGR